MRTQLLDGPARTLRTRSGEGLALSGGGVEGLGLSVKGLGVQVWRVERG